MPTILTIMQLGIAFGVTAIGLVFFTILGFGGENPASYTHAFIGALIANEASQSPQGRDSPNLVRRRKP